MPTTIKDDLIHDLCTPPEKIWYTLKYGPKAVTLRIEKVARDDGPPEQPCYIKYFVTDKPQEVIDYNDY